MYQLFTNLEKFGGRLSPELKEHLATILKYKALKKGEYLLREGAVARHIWFMESGLVQIFKRAEQGEDTRWILEDFDFVVAPDTFPKVAVTRCNMYVLEDTTLHFVTIGDLQATCRLFPQFHDHYAFIEGHYRAIEFKLRDMNPEERFDFYWNNHRNFFFRVKHETMASLLQVNPKTLDKYRKQRGS